MTNTSAVASDHWQDFGVDTLVGTLVACGLRDFVVSPGSRNTPLCIAANAYPNVNLIPVIDERAAAFVALGMARSTGQSIGLICTSGTAGAHYLPAVIEAYMADVPLVVLTADRPPELIGSGAPQTIDQTHLLAGYVRYQHSLAPCMNGDSTRAMQRVATEALRHSNGVRPGPVHVNVQLRKPLPSDYEFGSAVQIAQSQAHGADRIEIATTIIAEAARTLCASSKPVAIAGPLPAYFDCQPLIDFLVLHGIPLIAESTSQMRHGNSADLVPMDNTTISEIIDTADCIVRIGDAPVSIELARALYRNHAKEHIAMHPTHGTDSTNANPTSLIGDLRSATSQLSASLQDWACTSWLVEATRPSQLSVPLKKLEWSHAAVCRGVAHIQQNDDAVILGNGVTVREFDRSFDPLRTCVRIQAQRGVSGIDGMIAGLVGTAMATAGHSTLLCGDVAAVHDLGSLLLAAQVETNATIVVVNNNGGRIFDKLPVADMPRHTEVFRQCCLTPTAVDLTNIAAAMGLTAVQARNLEELQAALKYSRSHQGVSVIECIVPC